MIEIKRGKPRESCGIGNAFSQGLSKLKVAELGADYSRDFSSLYSDQNWDEIATYEKLGVETD